MLAREFRLRRTNDINRVYTRGKFAASGDLAIKALTNNLGVTRTAVVVGRKTSTKAVVRNRIRRRLSEIMHKLWPQVEVGYDIVVNVRRDVSDSPQAELEKALKSCLERAGVINKGSNHV